VCKQEDAPGNTKRLQADFQDLAKLEAVVIEVDVDPAAIATVDRSR
jgi:hypothetical protein